MQNERSAKWLTQKTSNSHVNSSGKFVRKTRKESSKPAIDVIERNEFSNNGIQEKTLASDLLRICRPLSVYLTRLPDSLVNKNVEVAREPPVRRKKLQRWRHGSYARKYPRNKKQKTEADKHPQALHSQITENQSNSSELVTSPGSSTSLNTTGTFTTTVTLPSAVERSTVKENESVDTQARLQETVFGSLVCEKESWEAQEHRISNTVGLNAAPSSSDTYSNFEEIELAKERVSQIEFEPCAETEISPLASLASEEESHDRTLLVEKNSTENSTSEGYRNLSPSRQGRKRKNSSLSESSGPEQVLQQSSKKLRPLSLTSENSVSPLKERKATTANGIAVTSPGRQVLLTNLKKLGATSQEQHRGSEKNQSMNEAVVVVNRLDTSRSPLVEKWKNKVDLSWLDEVTSNSRESFSVSTSSINQVEKENESEFEATIIDNESKGMKEYSPALMDLQSFDNYKNNDIVMCDSNEDDSEEDDNEIIEFLAARRRRKSSMTSTHSEYKTDDEPNESQHLSRSSSKTREAKRSDSYSSLKRTRGRSRKRKESFDTMSENSGSTRSRRIQSKSPASRKSRKARRYSYADSDDLSYREARSPPITRSRSRAVIENLYSDDSMNSNDVFRRTNNRKICYRIRSDSSDNSREAQEENGVSDENETQAAVVENTENVHDIVVESERTEENNETPELAAANDFNFTLTDNVQFDRDTDIENCIARKKLTTMKDAMVVLTRLEDLNNQYSDGETVFDRTRDYDFSSNFSTHENYNDETSCRSVDPLQIDNSSAIESPVPRENGRGPLSVQSDQDQKRARVSDRSVQSGSDTALIRKDRALRDMSESDDEGQLVVDETVSTETTDSDGERMLIVDEDENTTTGTIRISSEGVLMDANGNDDKAKRTPLKDPAEPGKCGNCDEHQDDNTHDKCQNISPSQKCITCDRSFKDSAQLEHHKTSSAFCSSGFRCNFCQINFKTLIELSKHRAVCAEKKLQRRNSLDPKTHEEASSEPQTSVITNSEASRPKGKKKQIKKTSQKNPPKKNRNRPRCRSDNLTCNVCSMNFDTKTNLSEHLYKHSPEELQEAFRAAKAKAMADSQAEQAAKRKKIITKESSRDEPADNQASIIIDPTNINAPPSSQNLGENETRIIVSDVNTIASTASLNNDSLTSRLATVCLCHRDTDLTSVDKTDLQIEMVLLCKYCHVIFRRRECLEVHYRTSSICSVNRTRERCPSFFCANCQITLNSWADMRKHLEIHAHQNSERTIRFVCNICRVVFVGFGVLFYNHWTSHSKDPMFVACRYNFPKFSVQAKTGTEKLPAGARSEENYIFVAEHVCATCKRPFSTRRDLETHQQSVSCTKPSSVVTTNNVNNTQQSGRPDKVNRTPKEKEAPISIPKQTPKKPQNNNTRRNERSVISTTLTAPCADKNNYELVNKRMYCDVCHLAFLNEHWLNVHSRNIHDDRFTFIPTTVTGTPLLLPFKCNKCSAFTASVSAIEEHWRTDVLHEHTAASLKKMKSSSILAKSANISAPAKSSLEAGSDSQNSLIHASVNDTNNAMPTDNSKTSKEPLIITIDDADSNGGASRASKDTPTNQDVLTYNEESVVPVPPITSPDSIQVPGSNECPVVRSLSATTASTVSNLNEKQRAKIRALEDPCVNVMLSETSGGANLSASLVIENTVEKPVENTVNGITESYRILLSNQPSPGNLKMVLNRTSSTDSAEGPGPFPATGTSTGENNDSAQTESSDPTISADLVQEEEPASVLSAQSLIAKNNDSAQTQGADQKPLVDSDTECTLVVLTQSAVGHENYTMGALTQISDSTAHVDSDEESRLVILTQSTLGDENKKTEIITQLTDSTSKITPNRTVENGPESATNISVVPEVIDILDDADDCENEQPTEHQNPSVITTSQSLTESLIDTNKILNSLLESETSNTDQRPTDVSAVTVDVPEVLSVVHSPRTFDNSSGSDNSSIPMVGKSGSPGRSKLNKAALKLCTVSFEEARWNWLESSSTSRAITNSTAPKKQGFLRVKDLSELQAVKSYTCGICNSSFESEILLEGHRRLPMCGNSIQGRNVQYPRGISAALVLPDPSERPQTPETNPSPLDQMHNNTISSMRRSSAPQPSVYPLREISGVAPGQRIQTIGQLPTIAVNNKALGSWTSIVGNTPVTGINFNPVQENRPLQQKQLTTMSGGSVMMQESNERLPENRNSSLNYHHPLPQMISLPIASTNNQQLTIASQQHVASSNPLPKCTAGRNAPMIIHHPDKRNKYQCTICHTFECASLEAISEHLRKHYHGWKSSTVAQDSTQPAPVARVSASSSSDTVVPLSSSKVREASQQILAKNTRTGVDTDTNRLTPSDWTVKDTPQGPVYVTPVSSESNNNRSVLRQTSFNSNNLASNAPYSAQLVFRCRICKSAVYKNYSPLRNHAILVHGITDFNSLVQENISLNSYLCTQCPYSRALFDTAEEFREHVDTIHTHSCPSCQRVFSNFLTLRHHLEQCRVSTSSNRNAYGNNC